MTFSFANDFGSITFAFYLMTVVIGRMQVEVR